MWKLTIRPEWNCDGNRTCNSRTEVFEAVQSWCETRDRFSWSTDTRNETLRKMGTDMFSRALSGNLYDMAVPHEAGTRTDTGRVCGRWYAIEV